MFKLSIKGVLAHKMRLLTTALAVMLGVAFMAGTLVLTDTIGRTFDNLFSDVYKNTSAVVRAKAEFDGPNNSGQQRARVDAALVGTLRGVDGVDVAEGETFGYARIVGKDGTALGNPAMGAPTVGSNWSENKQVNPWRLFAGTPPVTDNDVVIDKKSADDGGYKVGDTATVLVQGPPVHPRISGIAKFGTADSPGGASFAMWKPDVAQRLVAEPGKYDSIALVAKSGVSQTELVDRISRVLPPGTEALTGAKITKETQSDFRKAFRFFNTFLLVFAFVALVVGAFMIFNTFSITVAQRTRENALLRALGASKRQVLASVMIEAVAVGLLASIIGIGVGVLVAGGLKALLAAFGLEVPAGGVVLASRTIIVSILVGTLVTLISALSPARKAGKVPPVAAMQDVPIGSTGYGSKQRIFVGAGILLLGAVALLGGLFGNASNKLPPVALGVLLVFFGVSVLGRTVSLPLSRIIGWPLPRTRGVTGGLARENAMRNPKRTAASASALMIGVGLVAFITIFAQSTKASINSAIDQNFVGDYVIDSNAGMSGGVDPGLAGKLNHVPGVEAATGVRAGAAKFFDSVKVLYAADPKVGFDIVSIKPQAGNPHDLGVDSVAVYKDEASAKHLKVGDPVPVVFKDTGPQTLRVAVIYGEKRATGNADYLLGMPAYDANFANRYDFQVYVKKAPGADSKTTLVAVKQVAKDYPGVKVLDQTGYKAEQAASINQLLYLIYALLGLAIVIALLGIGNTLALSIFERTRELGLLRAVGMTRAQLKSTIRWESVIVAVQGTVLGMVIGIFFGWALVTAMKDKGVSVFAIPVTQLVVVLFLAAIAGVVAAILPGRRASKLNVLKAIVTE